jgi:hypothetical protein
MDEDWRAGRHYMRKDSVETISKRFPDRKNKEFILEESLINVKAQNAIYTT